MQLSGKFCFLESTALSRETVRAVTLHTTKISHHITPKTQAEFVPSEKKAITGITQFVILE